MAGPITVTDDTFENEVIKAGTPVLVDFWADWCAPCKMIAPIVEQLADEYDGSVRFAKLRRRRQPQDAHDLRDQGHPDPPDLRRREACRSDRRRSAQVGTEETHRRGDSLGPGRIRQPLVRRVQLSASSRERMGPGGLRGLQIRWPRPFGRGGGFDSLSLPPLVIEQGAVPFPPSLDMSSTRQRSRRHGEPLLPSEDPGGRIRLAPGDAADAHEGGFRRGVRARRRNLRVHRPRGRSRHVAERACGGRREPRPPP